MPNKKTDERLSSGFEAGAYACAYETTSYAKALACLSPNRHAEYLAAFTLGFFASYEISEMGPHDETYLEAYHSAAGARCRELGYVDDDSEDEGPNDEWTRVEP